MMIYASCPHVANHMITREILKRRSNVYVCTLGTAEGTWYNGFLASASRLSSLNWSTHVYSLSRKCKRQIGMIHREATPETKANIGVVLATLDYCGAVWDPHQSTLVNKLKSVLCLLTQ